VVGDPDQSIYKWRGADLKNILDFEHDFPEAMIRASREELPLDAGHSRRGVVRDAQNRNRKEKRLYTDRAGGARILYYRAGDDIDEAEFIARTSRTALHEDPDNTVAVLYRTNAQSRTVEDALRRAGMAYKIIGGVRFYERKEIKDALAYLRLVLNPHDDVSLRRVINVPARGIGKGVVESLDAVELTDDIELPPLLAGLQPVATNNSMWARLIHALEGRLPQRPGVRIPCRISRPDRQPDVDGPRGISLDSVGKGAGPERLPAGSARGAKRGGRKPDREPDGTGLGAREYETRTANRPSPASSISLSLLQTRTRRLARATRGS
jgi:hypothetical protein